MNIWPWSLYAELKALRQQNHMLNMEVQNLMGVHDGRRQLVIVAKGRKAKLREFNIDVAELDSISLKDLYTYDEEKGWTQRRTAPALPELRRLRP